MDCRIEYAVFADGEENRKTAMQASDGAARMFSDWRAFTRTVGDVRAAAVILPELSSARSNDLAALKNEYPLLPLVLVTDLNPNNARILQQLPVVEEVLFLAELQGLRASLVRAERQNLLNRAVGVIEAQKQLSPELRATLRKACRLREPVRSVHRLANEIMGYSASELRAHWRAGARPGTKVHDFIDWLLVASACIEWRPGLSRSSIAQHFGVDARTLEGALRRRFGGVPLRNLLLDSDLVLGNLERMLRPHGD